MPAVESAATDAKVLKLLNRAADAISRRSLLDGPFRGCPGCQTVYRRWAERHAEAERRGLDWRTPCGR